MIIDIFAALVALFAFWYGKDRGIVGIVFGVLSITFGLVVAYKMTPVTARVLKGISDSDSPFLILAAFFVNILFIWLLLKATGSSISTLFQAFRIGLINQVLGGLLSAFVALLLYGAVLGFLRETRILNEEAMNNSKTLNTLAELPKNVGSHIGRLKPLLREAWDTGLKWVETAREYGERQTQGLEPSSPLSEGEQLRIYKIEETDTNRIERRPYRNNSGKNRELYEDTGIEY
ncbi:MAG: CvpA family protein [Saprospiraceae bacterium]|nr:CvpA family protein [Saprospiraceae bacterium]MDW8484433.1 CvpA family protein [Saprospiraceae bacterium]